MAENDDDTATRAKGRLEEAVGWAAGDRRVEAKGRVEEETGDPPGEEELEDVENDVRREHGDI